MFRFSVWFLLACLTAPAVVKSVHVIERSDVLDRKAFGTAGPYERVVAKAVFTVDPSLPANQIVTDLALAPRNTQGLVEFSADIYVLKPTDPARGNGTALFEVSNRGNKGLLSMFNLASGSLDPSESAHFGDGFLLERGFTLIWIGWQFDVPDLKDRMRLFAPFATRNGQPITGPVRAEFITDRPATEMPLGDRNHMAYAPVSLDDRTAQLTVRDRCDSGRKPLPRDAWKFNADGQHITMQQGFVPGKVYEVVYTAKDPVVVGLGPAAIRDFISYLKYGSPAASINVLGDQRRFLKRAIGFGTSQSGRFLRTFLFYGFNADEQGRIVFDGVWSHVAGGGRGSFNHRFAQASRDGHPHFNCTYPTDIFPFTDLTQRDPETGLAGGILAKTSEQKVVPKVFYTNSSYEYWGRAAGLIHSTLDGKQDAELAPTSRAYLFAGTQHGAGAWPPNQSPNYQHPSNANDYRWHMRALLTAMNDWVTAGKEPPAAQVPQVSKDQLVAPGAVRFPKLPGVKIPARPQRAYRADYGPEFRTNGVVSQEPPVLGKPFAVLVPQVDMDGNETAGIRAPVVQVPLATYTGWNLRSPSIGAPEEIYSMVGSTFLLAKDKTERQIKNDPRPSIAERYASKQDYLDKYTAAAKQLAREGYLLDADIPRLVELGSKYWDTVTR
ncbi:MAG: hypothetical protein JNN08_30640 [Bryobacterales bacterium]|nr:hypothetical protein [Bryobacterales bacterium]